MKRRALVGALLMAGILSGCGGGGANGSIEGTVEDSYSVALPNAHVRLSVVASEEERTTTTDGQGRFRFERLEAGDYVLIVQCGGGLVTATSATLEKGEHLRRDVECG